MKLIRETQKLFSAEKVKFKAHRYNDKLETWREVSFIQLDFLVFLPIMKLALAQKFAAHQRQREGGGINLGIYVGVGGKTLLPL